MTPPHPFRTAAAAALLISALLGAAACATPAPTASSSQAADFTITGYTFPALVAAPGATITIADSDDEPHTVTADDGSFDTGPFDRSAPGRLVAPTTPGIYPIHCTVHPSMHGTLTVR